MDQVATTSDGVASGGGTWAATPATPRRDAATRDADAVVVSQAPGMPGEVASLSEAVRAVLASPTDAAEAERRTRHLANVHYENFSVVSLLLPRHLRQDFCNIYAFCRVADDLGDELDNPAVSTAALGELRRQTLACREGQATSVLFIALGETMRRNEIPIEPFLDLIDAFQQDQRVSRYETFEQVVDYCRRSANPVGRLVLYLCDYRDEQRQQLSDQTCTALQLANFWQDVRRDLVDRDRIYLPAEDLRQFGVSEDDLRAGIQANRGGDAYAKLIEFEVNRTARMFDEGDALLPLLDTAVRGQVALYGKGGRAVLDAIRSQNFDTLARRPSLGKRQKGRLILSALMARLRSAGRTAGGGAKRGCA
jgi:squalene synthase HpnC